MPASLPPGLFQALPLPLAPSPGLPAPEELPGPPSAHLLQLSQLFQPRPHPVLTQLVITALKCHKYDKNIQVTGSAALFYLTNSEYRSEQSVKLRRQVIQVVLNGMESYQEVTVSPLPTIAHTPWPRHPFPAPWAQTQLPQGFAWLCVPPSLLPFPGQHSQTPGPGIRVPRTQPHQ